MPQLDHVSYFSQFFWLTLTFITFYFILATRLLPRIATILKTRRKLLVSSEDQIEIKSEHSIEHGYDTVLSEGLIKSQSLLEETLKDTNSWLQKEFTNSQKQQFQSAQSLYLEAVAQVMSKQYVFKALLNNNKTK